MIIINGQNLPIVVSLFGDVSYDHNHIKQLLQEEGVNTVVYRASSVLTPTSMLLVMSDITLIADEMGAMVELSLLKQPEFQSDSHLQFFIEELRGYELNRINILEPTDVEFKNLSNYVPIYGMNKLFANVFANSTEYKLEGKENENKPPIPERDLQFVLVEKTDRMVEMVNVNKAMLIAKNMPVEELPEKKDTTRIVICALSWSGLIPQQIEKFENAGYDDIQLAVLHLPNVILENEQFEELVTNKVSKIYTSNSYLVQSEKVKELVDKDLLQVSVV